MKTFMFLIASMLMTANATASIQPMFRDIKLPSQVVTEKQAFGAPIVATTNYVKTTYAGPVSAAAVTLSSFSHQPDVPRNLTITPTGTTGDVESCDVLVVGTNYYGAVISETFSFLANASTATVGNKAFKSVSSVTWPANCESGGFAATWIIGVGEKIGLKNCLDAAGDWVSSSISGVYETTRATLAVSSSAVESNTADFNGTMDGSATFTGYFYQNFRCNP